MKPLVNHLILFDAECPMCRLYTNAFVSTGLLDKNGRMAYQTFPAEACPILDRQRAINEIALVNQTTGEVTYGIKSLFKIFGQAVPLFKPLFSFEPFIWLMSKLYAFISYNRRVIIPAGKPDSFQYQPDFKLQYRIAYLLFTWALTSYILTQYVHLMQGLLPQGSAYREYLVCGGQIIFQGMVISILAKDQFWNYLGNMITISFSGALLLCLGLLAAKFFAIAPLIYTLYFLAVAGSMFLEHIRRTKLLNLGWTLTTSWVCYRLGVLVLIYLIN